MKRQLAAALIAGLTALGAQAAAINVPASGSSEFFNWSNGLSAADDSFNITVGGASKINVMLTDQGLAGDEFSLKLDGHLVNWTSTGLSGINFQGVANGVYLSAGAHTFDIYVTSLAPGYTDGFGSAEFSAVTAVTAVPEPATYGMLLAGLGLLAATSRRKQT